MPGKLETYKHQHFQRASPELMRKIKGNANAGPIADKKGRAQDKVQQMVAERASASLSHLALLEVGHTCALPFPSYAIVDPSRPEQLSNLDYDQIRFEGSGQSARPVVTSAFARFAQARREQTRAPCS